MQRLKFFILLCSLLCLSATSLVVLSQKPAVKGESVPTTILPVFVQAEVLQSKEPIEQPSQFEKKSVEVKPTIFGKSLKGRDIAGHIFGTGDDVILVFGSIHGNEMGTVGLANSLVKELNANPDLVGASKKVVIIPMINPDGYYDRTDKLNANGVNLNLNFETSAWKQYGGENGDFAGNGPFSEPESRILREVVTNQKVKKMISLHAKGSLVNPEVNESSKSLARRYASMAGYSYFFDPSWDYPGTATRWFVEKFGGPAITVELSTFYSADWAKNKKALLEILR